MSASTLPLADESSSPAEKDVRNAVAVLIRTWHAEASMEEWPDIAKKMGSQVRCNTRVVTGVLEKLVGGTHPKN